MAIDTRAKRASVQAYTLGLVRPAPDGTISAADRAVSAWFYAGITYSSEVTQPAWNWRSMGIKIGVALS